MKSFALLLLLIWSAVPAATPTIPSDCAQYQWAVVRNVYARFGPGAAIAPYGSQMMQESGCNAKAKSGVGAQGLTQFMPDTAKWIATLDGTLSPPDPMNPQWAIRAMVYYDQWLMKRNKGRTECDTYAFALSAYNGGEGWLRRDQAYTAKHGLDSLVWFGVVSDWPDPRRSESAIRENRGYPDRILLSLQPRFVSAGWGRSVNCP